MRVNLCGNKDIIGKFGKEIGGGGNKFFLIYALTLPIKKNQVSFLQSG